MLRAGLRFVCVGAAVVAAMPVARAVAAPSLSTPLRCLDYDQASQNTFPVSGTGFPANAQMFVSIAGDIGTEVATTTDAQGDLAVRVKGSSYWNLRPRIATIEVREPSVQHPPQLLATLPIEAVALGATLNPVARYSLESVHARLRAVLAGEPGRSLYVHYWWFPPHTPHHVRLLRTRRLGGLASPCGVLTTTFSIFGTVRPRVGGWTVGIDSNRRPPTTVDWPGAAYYFLVLPWDGRGTPPVPRLRRGQLFIRG